MSGVCHTETMAQRGFAFIGVVVGIVLLVFLGFAIQHFTGFSLPKRSSLNSETVGNIIPGGRENEGSCESKEIPKFTAELTDINKINAINPIGGIGGGSPGRSYIGVLKEVEAPVYAPTDMVLENIIYAKRPKDPKMSLSNTGPEGEYGLFFRLNCNVTILFDHIDKVSDKIKQYAPEKPTETSRVENPPINIPVKKGELLGYTDGTDLARTFDFLLQDMSKPAPHINPKRWQWDQAVYAQCPYDYFTDELKAKYYAKIGEAIEKSTGREFIPAEGCGQLSHDKSGTISGGWFKGESTDTKGDYLAIARTTKSKMVNVAIKKDGLFGPDSDLRDYSPKAYPEDIKVGQEVCYQDQNANMWAYVKLLSDTQLAFARGNGSCPASFPQNLSETWER